MYKCLFIALSVFSYAAQADSYFECDTASDPLIVKACASPVTVEKARRFNAQFLQVFANGKSPEEVKTAIKIKNEYRSAISGCRANQNTFSICAEAALDKATVGLNSAYMFDVDPTTLDASALKESAHRNAGVLKDQARKVPAQCLKDEAKKLDDQVSNASDIGLGVAQACKPKAIEFATYASDTLILWDVLNPISRMNPDQVNDLSERSFGAQAATKAVLEGRVEKYKAETNKPKAKKKKRNTTAK